METSCFGRSGNDPHAVAISRGIPKWYTGARYMPLAPSWALLNEKREDVFREQYLRQLAHLDPHTVLNDLGPDAILLCWERPGVFCHRRVGAEWLESETGIPVPEVSTAKGE